VLQSSPLVWPALATPGPVTYMEQKTQAIFSWGINTTVRHPVSTHWGWEALMALLNQQQKTLNIHSTPAPDIYFISLYKEVQYVLERQSLSVSLLFLPRAMENSTPAAPISMRPPVPVCRWSERVSCHCVGPSNKQPLKFTHTALKLCIEVEQADVHTCSVSHQGRKHQVGQMAQVTACVCICV